MVQLQVNDSFGVEWPERPSYGRYSLDAYEVSMRFQGREGDRREEGRRSALLGT